MAKIEGRPRDAKITGVDFYEDKERLIIRLDSPSDRPFWLEITISKQEIDSLYNYLHGALKDPPTLRG